MKDIKTTAFWRKTYPVQAIRLTSENIRQVAAEIGADFWDPANGWEPPYDVKTPHISDGKSQAFIGDWVVEGVEGGYTFFVHEAFMRKFWTHSEEMSSNEEYARVFQLVMSAMSRQDAATYHGDSNNGMDLVAAEVTKKILGQF